MGGESTWTVLGQDCAPSFSVQERERRDHEKARDSLTAEAVAFLLSARESLQKLSIKSSYDSQTEGILASISRHVLLALSAVDEFSVAQLGKAESRAGIGPPLAYLPTLTACLDDLTEL